MEAESDKMMLRAQHEPKELRFGNDDFSIVHENGEYLGEINERIDVLMSVSRHGWSKLFEDHKTTTVGLIFG